MTSEKQLNNKRLKALSGINPYNPEQKLKLIKKQFEQEQIGREEIQEAYNLAMKEINKLREERERMAKLLFDLGVTSW